MSVPAQGEIWWAEAEDKRRPVLVVTRSETIYVLTSVVVAPVTRTIRDIPTEVPLGPHHGLRQDCVANFDTLQSVKAKHLDEPHRRAQRRGSARASAPRCCERSPNTRAPSSRSSGSSSAERRGSGRAQTDQHLTDRDGRRAPRVSARRDPAGRPASHRAVMSARPPAPRARRGSRGAASRRRARPCPGRAAPARRAGTSRTRPRRSPTPRPRWPRRPAATRSSPGFGGVGAGERVEAVARRGAWCARGTTAPRR